MFRLVFLTFLGKARFDTQHVHPHESPAVMTMPLIVLAVASVVVGFARLPAGGRLVPRLPGAGLRSLSTSVEHDSRIDLHDEEDRPEPFA